MELHIILHWPFLTLHVLQVIRIICKGKINIINFVKKNFFSFTFQLFFYSFFSFLNFLKQLLINKFFIRYFRLTFLEPNLITLQTSVPFPRFLVFLKCVSHSKSDQDSAWTKEKRIRRRRRSQSNRLRRVRHQHQRQHPFRKRRQANVQEMAEHKGIKNSDQT